jgi:prolyl-tRNA editing enzyme YbaK/EbsC (Cys-tRNA(Pro) deacylase)
VAKIVKCLIFEAGDEPILVLAAGTNRVSLAKLELLIGRRPSRADADAVKRYTGFPIGGVAPVGLERTMPVFIDADLLGQTDLWAAAGTPHAVFRCAARELARVSGGSFVDVKE